MIIELVRLFSLLVVRAKHKTFEILHTYGNKASGILLFVFPFFLAYGNININLFAYILCGVASFSAVEVLWIHLSSHELQAGEKASSGIKPGRCFTFDYFYWRCGCFLGLFKQLVD